MLAAVFVAAAGVTLCRPPARPAPAPAVPSAARAAAASPEALYSLRARRRVVNYLRLRLLEMREEGLDRAAAAVRRRFEAGGILPEREP